jgi:hypothetical protein
MYTQTFAQMTKGLGQLNKWLDAAAEYAKTKNVDPNVFASQRLALDQFPLTRQVQICCDTAKLAASYLSGKAAPTHADNEQTLEELKTRVQSTIAYLETLGAVDFNDAATRVVSQPRWKGEWMTGEDYLIQHAIPNFFFHLTTAYAILRHNGVNLGKRDYLGQQTKRPPAA